MLPAVNYVMILVAAVAAMALGFAWYGPMLFGKPWMKLMGHTEKSMEAAKKEMGKTYAISTVGSLVMAFVLAVVLQLFGSETLLGGAKTGALMWLGFVSPVQMTDVLFSSKKWNLYFINTGYQLTSLIVMGAILAMWG